MKIASTIISQHYTLQIKLHTMEKLYHNFTWIGKWIFCITSVHNFYSIYKIWKK